MTDKRAFEALLDDLLGASFDQDWSAEKKARAAVLQAYDEAAGREGEPVASAVSSADYWQRRGHHVCPDCAGTRVRSYRQADHLGGQYVDVPCSTCTTPPPASVPAGFKLLGYANAFRIKQTCADKPGGAHLGQVAIYAGESVDPMEIQERENPTHMGEPLLGHGWKPIGSAPRTPDAWFLAWHPDTGCGLTFWNAGKFYSYAPDDPPTHWMPLPASPDAPAGEKGT